MTVNNTRSHNLLFGTATLKVDDSVKKVRPPEFPDLPADRIDLRPNGGDLYSAQVEKETKHPEVQALAGRLADEFTLTYETLKPRGLNPNPHDTLKIEVTQIDGTTYTKTLPSDENKPPSVFWRQALKEALKIQEDFRTGGLLKRAQLKKKHSSTIFMNDDEAFQNTKIKRLVTQLDPRFRLVLNPQTAKNSEKLAVEIIVKSDNDKEDKPLYSETIYYKPPFLGGEFKTWMNALKRALEIQDSLQLLGKL